MEVNMKNNKWIKWLLITLLTLVVLVEVGGAGFRMGLMQGVNTAENFDGRMLFFNHMQRFDGDLKDKFGNDDENFDHPQMRGNDRGFGHGREHRGFSPLFGLVRLAVLGLLLWAGYKLYQKSGWQFVKVNALEAEPIEVKPEAKKKK